MKRLPYSMEIPDGWTTAWEATQSQSGRFNCPSCRADHVRRELVKTPGGRSSYSFRLRGHPALMGKKSEGPGRP